MNIQLSSVVNTFFPGHPSLCLINPHPRVRDGNTKILIATTSQISESTFGRGISAWRHSLTPPRREYGPRAGARRRYRPREVNTLPPLPASSQTPTSARLREIKPRNSIQHTLLALCRCILDDVYYFRMPRPFVTVLCLGLAIMRWPFPGFQQLIEGTWFWACGVAHVYLSRWTTISYRIFCGARY